jgi:uncharacterized protein YcbK (DUF882 family)
MIRRSIQSAGNSGSTAIVDRHDPTNAARLRGRRRFLSYAGALCGVAVLADGRRVLAGDFPSRARQLRFVHTHTGETLTAAYFDGDAYDPAVLGAVNHLLRDFRTGDVHAIDPPLLDLLHALQTRADYDAPFEIISGYRSPATNAMLHRNSHGVAEHSQHLLGKAIDVRLSGFSTRTLSEHALALAGGGVGFYAKSDFVHVDTGPVRSW